MELTLAQSSTLIAQSYHMNRLHRFDTLTAWYQEYLTINNYRPSTVKDYLFEVSFFRRYLEEQTEVKDIDELDAVALRNFTTSLYDHCRKPRTIHHKLAALRNFFASLYQEHKLYVNLAESLIMPRVGKSLPANILTEQETKALFDYLESKTECGTVRCFEDALLVRDRAIAEVLYSTAIRRKELLGLCLGDINAVNGLIMIRYGKGAKDRVVPIGKTGLHALALYIERARPLLSSMWTKDELFLNRWGSRLGPQGLRDIVDKVTGAAGLKKHVRIHDMRHTCATHMLNNGADIRFVQELLGHASLASTQVYKHVSINKLKETHDKYHPRERGETTEPEATNGTGPAD